MDISSYDLTQLKALAYDQINQIQLIQRNLNLIEGEIAKRVAAEQGKPLPQTGEHGNIGKK